jgi:hypothetical protein
MTNASEFRKRAATCRRAASRARRPSEYLLRLADEYDGEAEALENQFAGDKASAPRDPEQETE